MYKLMVNGVRRLIDGAFIPNDLANIDWRAYQEWLLAGNVPQPIDQPSQRTLIKAALAEIDSITLSKGVRGLREFILIQAQLTDAIITQGVINGVNPNDTISQNPGIVNVALLEQQATFLRNQLAQLPPE